MQLGIQQKVDPLDGVLKTYVMDYSQKPHSERSNGRTKALVMFEGSTARLDALKYIENAYKAQEEQIIRSFTQHG